MKQHAENKKTASSAVFPRSWRFAVAPMLDWTDSACRSFHRHLTRESILFSEMVVADAAIHGNRERLLGFHASEHPVALQLGGSDPVKLAEAARIVEDLGYAEIDLNVGCPSDRVQSGTFGACLMKTPDVVAECVSAMKRAVGVPVTVKCRIGVDDQDPEEALDRLAAGVIAAGTDGLWVHARKAWLQGLSPRENRDIPPLDYDRVYRLKKQYPGIFIGLNGGVDTLDAAIGHLDHVDGVMVGRAAYHTPFMLASVDRLIFGVERPDAEMQDVVQAMAEHARAHIAAGGRLAHITRHMVGLCHGLPGARRFRQILSTDATRPGASADILLAALAEVDLTPQLEKA